MSNENSDDELPSISLSQEPSTREIAMPSARDIAVEREREMHTEMELQRLREQHSPSPSKGVPAVPTPLRSDSSGSEGETHLAQAVRALSMLPGGPSRIVHLGTAKRLLTLLPASSQAAIQHYITEFEDDGSPGKLKTKTQRIVTSLSCALACESNTWNEDELLTCCGLLCAACLAASSLLVRRALHKALTLVTTTYHQDIPARLASFVTRAAVPSGPVPAARALLDLSDSARGGPPAADLLAALLVRRGLTIILVPNMADKEFNEPLTGEELSDLLTVRRGWKGVEPDARQTALRLAGRALAALKGKNEDKDGCAQALAALAQPLATADKHHPDYLKVVVAGSTLQLLFRAKP